MLPSQALEGCEMMLFVRFLPCFACLPSALLSTLQSIAVA